MTSVEMLEYFLLGALLGYGLGSLLIFIMGVQ